MRDLTVCHIINYIALNYSYTNISKKFSSLDNVTYLLGRVSLTKIPN